MREINRVAVIGAGVIGASFALLFAKNGLEVNLYDISKDALDAGINNISKNVDTLIDMGLVTPEEKKRILERVKVFDSLKDALSDVDFIQENGPERINIKREMLKEVEEYAPTDAIYSSSTSGLLISDIAKEAKYGERCIGGHPYNPPHLIPLIELTYTDKTSKECIEATKKFYESLGKEVVIINKECPGFIANRLQLAVYREMIDLVMRGVCSAEDADKALTYGPGIRWAIFGHNMIMQLGNPKGLTGMMEMLGDGGDVWLRDMADWKHIPREEYVKIAQPSVDEMMKNFPDYKGHDNASCAKFRDKSLIEILKLHKKI